MLGRRGRPSARDPMGCGYSVSPAEQGFRVRLPAALYSLISPFTARRCWRRMICSGPSGTDNTGSGPAASGLVPDAGATCGDDVRMRRAPGGDGVRCRSRSRRCTLGVRWPPSVWRSRSLVARAGVQITLAPSEANTSPKGRGNFASPSRMRKRTCSARSPRPMIRLRACWASTRPSGSGWRRGCARSAWRARSKKNST
jgi:hypothetical protein